MASGWARIWTVDLLLQSLGGPQSLSYIPLGGGSGIWTWVSLLLGVVDVPCFSPSLSLSLYFSIVDRYHPSIMRMRLHWDCPSVCCACLIQTLTLTFPCPLPLSLYGCLSCQMQIMTVLLLLLVSGAAVQWGEHRSVFLRAWLWQALKTGNPGNPTRGRDNFLAPLMSLPGKRFSLSRRANSGLRGSCGSFNGLCVCNTGRAVRIQRSQARWFPE